MQATRRESYRWLVLAIASSTLVGCATMDEVRNQRMNGMLSRSDSKAIVLATITLNHQDEPSHALNPYTIVVREAIAGRDVQDTLVKRTCGPGLGDDCVRTLSPGRWLIALEYDPGKYVLYSVRGQITGGFSSPLFEVPILLPFEANKKEITYIGNVNVVLRKRLSDAELRAGPSLPLLDQPAINGLTFDVRISDQYESDIAAFKKSFSGLSGREIARSVLPSWRRPTEQEFEPSKTSIRFF